MDETGETNYQLMGTTQLLSVPYALYSKNSQLDFQFNTYGKDKYEPLIIDERAYIINFNKNNYLNVYNFILYTFIFAFTLLY